MQVHSCNRRSASGGRWVWHGCTSDQQTTDKTAPTTPHTVHTIHIQTRRVQFSKYDFGSAFSSVLKKTAVFGSAFGFYCLMFRVWYTEACFAPVISLRISEILWEYLRCSAEFAFGTCVFSEILRESQGNKKCETVSVLLHHYHRQQ